MKKLLTIVLVLLTELSFAQYFTLTPNGFVSSTDKSGYVIIDKPKATQKDLYKDVLNALSTIYKDPKEVLSLVDGESISIKGYETKILPVKHKTNKLQIGKTSYEYDISYNLTILFKDGKIRFNNPTFECRRWYEGGPSSGYESGWTTLNLVKEKNDRIAIYNTNGELILEDARNGLNNYFNALIKEIIEKSGKINNW